MVLKWQKTDLLPFGTINVTETWQHQHKEIPQPAACIQRHGQGISRGGNTKSPEDVHQADRHGQGCRGRINMCTGIDTHSHTRKQATLKV